MTPWRQLIFRLLIPRPLELTTKGLLLPLAAMVAAIYYRGRPFPEVLSETAIAWLLFEFLLYQGRYTINDLLDRRHDTGGLYGSHRLPLGVCGDGNPCPLPPDGIAAIFVAITSRLVIFLYVTLAIRGLDQLGKALIIAGLTLAILTAAYEALRARTRVAAVKPLKLTWLKVAIYFLVGSGYALRVVLGWWLGASGHASLTIFATLGTSAWLFGVTSVLMTWILEGSASVPLHPSPAHVYDTRVSTKNHLGPLLVTSELVTRDAVEAQVGPPDATAGQLRLFKSGSHPASGLFKAWNLIFMLACCGCSLLTAEMAGLLSKNHLTVAVPCVFAGGLCGLVSVRAPALFPALASGILLAGAIYALILSASSNASPVIVVPTVGICIFTIILRTFSYADLNAPKRGP